MLKNIHLFNQNPGTLRLSPIIPHTLEYPIFLNSQFNKLKDILSTFKDIPLESNHFIKAAEFNNICRKKGVQGSTIDFLICAVATNENLIIFTTDKGFENYRKYLPIKLL